MTAPTVPVTVSLADFGGAPLAGILVTAKMSGIDYMADGTIVSSKMVSATTDVNGVAVLQCFPNDLAPNGLGTRGTYTSFHASLPGSKSLSTKAVIPNQPCNLVDVVVEDVAPPPPGYVTEQKPQSLTNKELVNPSVRTAVLVDGPIISWDTADGQTASLTMSTNQPTRVLNNPSHLKDGALYSILVTNSAAGGQQITTFGSAYVLNGMSISSVANSVTVLMFLSLGGKLYGVNTGGGSAPPATGNHTPVNTVPGAQTTGFGTPLVFNGANGNTITVDDADGDNLTTTVSVNSGTLTATTGVSATITNNGTPSVTIAGTIAAVNAALFGLTYTPAIGFSGGVILTIATRDAVISDTDTIAITVAAASGNHPPVNTVPSGQSIAHDTNRTFSTGNSNAITVADADGDSLTTVLTLSGGGGGTLTAVTGGGATITSNGTSAVTIAGTIAQVNAALNGLVFHPTSGSSGVTTLNVHTSDGTDVDSDNILLTVAGSASSQADTVQPLASHEVDYLQVGNYWVVDGRWGMASYNTAQEPDLTEGPASYQYRQKIERSLIVNPEDSSVACRWQISWPQFNSLNHAIQDNSFYSEVKTYPSILFGKKPGFYGPSMWPAFSYAIRAADGVTEPVPNPSFTPTPIKNKWQPLGGSVVQTEPCGATPGAGTTVMPLQLPLTSKTARIRGKFRHEAPPTGRGHLSFDIWLTATGPQVQGHPQSSMTHEIMIPLDNWGAPHPYGQYPYRNPSWYDHDVTIDGVLFHVYCTKRLGRNPVTGVYDGNPGSGLGYYPGFQYTFGGLDPVNHYVNEETGSDRLGWKLIVFQPDNPADLLDVNGYFNIDLPKFTAHLAATLDERGIAFIRNTEYMASIELGIELIWGDVDMTLYNYMCQVANTVVAAPPLPVWGNHTPVNTVPGAQTPSQDTAFIFSNGAGNAISVLDLDNDTLTTVVSVTHGTLTAVTGGGATISTNGTASVQIVGTGVQINAALDGLSYMPTSGYTGADTLHIVTTDPSAASDTDNVSLTVQAVSTAPTLLQAQFTAGNAGWWGATLSGVNDFWEDAAKTTRPGGFTFGTHVAAVWSNHGNPGTHDFVETRSGARPNLGTDGGGKKYVNGYGGNTIVGSGGATTAFYLAFALDWDNYYGTVCSDQSAANSGIRLYQSADLGNFVISAGNGSLLKTAQVNNGVAQYNTPSGKVLIEAWFDGTNLVIRRNKGTPVSTAFGASAITAGNADLMLFSNYPQDTDTIGGAKVYSGVVLKNYCPNSTDRDIIASWVAAQAGLTV